jgi:hypothetical protein
MILLGVGGLVVSASGGFDGQRGEEIAFIFYPLLGFLYIVPSVFLFRYGTRIGRLAREPSHRRLESSLEAQKSFWRFVGILTLVLICCLVLTAAIAIGVGLMAVRR